MLLPHRHGIARNLRVTFLAAVVLLASGCASMAVPPPGSAAEQDVIAQGADIDRQIEAQFGFYEDEALTVYVSSVGERIGAVSEWKSLPWRFRVLDTPVVNAFAVPGGYIYVTRGLLAYVNSEAELAGVLGHEATHVTSRHSAEQQRRSTFVGLGLLLGGALVPEFGTYGLETGLAQSAAGLFLLRYSRSQEHEADEKGIGYAIAAGYDPRGIGDFFNTLQSLETADGGRIVPGWASTHPPVEDRIARNAAASSTAIAARPDGATPLVVDAAPYLHRIDAIVFGDNPRQGFSEGARFLHPDLRFQLDFPVDWSVDNARQSVQALSPRQDAAVLLTIARPAEGESSEQYARRFLDKIDARVVAFESARINGLRAWKALIEVPRANPEYRVTAAWIEQGGNLYEILGISAPQQFSGYEGAFSAALASFRELRDRRALSVQPAHLGIVTVVRAGSLTEFLSARTYSVAPETIARLNNTQLSSSLSEGRLVKMITGGLGVVAAPGGSRMPSSLLYRQPATR